MNDVPVPQRGVIGAKDRVAYANRQAAVISGRRVASFGDVVGVNTRPATMLACGYVKKGFRVDKDGWEAAPLALEDEFGSWLKVFGADLRLNFRLIIF